MDKIYVRLMAAIIIIVSLLYILLPQSALIVPARGDNNISSIFQYSVLAYLHGWMQLALRPALILRPLSAIGIYSQAMRIDLTLNVVMVIVGLFMLFFKEWARKLFVRYAVFNLLIMALVMLQNIVFFRASFASTEDGIWQIGLFFVLPMLLQRFFIKYFDRPSIKTLFEVPFS